MSTCPHCNGIIPFKKDNDKIVNRGRHRKYKTIEEAIEANRKRALARYYENKNKNI